jgi:uncharacterized membrane protein
VRRKRPSIARRAVHHCAPLHLIKGWAITLANALLGIALKDDSRSMAAVAFLAMLPTLCFWLLDTYYFAAERAVRGQYRTLAPQNAGPPDVSVKLSIGLVHPAGDPNPL